MIQFKVLGYQLVFQWRYNTIIYNVLSHYGHCQTQDLFHLNIFISWYKVVGITKFDTQKTSHRIFHVTTVKIWNLIPFKNIDCQKTWKFILQYSLMILSYRESWRQHSIDSEDVSSELDDEDTTEVSK